MRNGTEKIWGGSVWGWGGGVRRTAMGGGLVRSGIERYGRGRVAGTGGGCHLGPFLLVLV